MNHKRNLKNHYKFQNKYINTNMQSIIDFILKEEAIKEELFSNRTLLEAKGDPIDEQWLNDEKPVMTKDGRQVIITEIDLKEVPNIIKGQVKMKTKLFDYEWLDDGTCSKALDQLGNPKKPEDADTLVKAI